MLNLLQCRVPTEAEDDSFPRRRVEETHFASSPKLPYCGEEE